MAEKNLNELNLSLVTWAYTKEGEEDTFAVVEVQGPGDYSITEVQTFDDHRIKRVLKIFEPCSSDDPNRLQQAYEFIDQLLNMTPLQLLYYELKEHSK